MLYFFVFFIHLAFCALDYDGTTGFQVVGAPTVTDVGFAVSAGFDINGDNLNDLVYSFVSVDTADSSCGAVIFGNTSYSDFMNHTTIDGVNGFILTGMPIGGAIHSIHTNGDFNNDGINDILIDAKILPDNGLDYTGEAYLIYGSSTWSSTFNLSTLDGTNGFTITGYYYPSQGAVMAMGDITGDNFDEIFILLHQGDSYLISGTGAAPAVINVTTYPGTMAKLILPTHLYLTYSIAIGDMNQDGFKDWVLSVPAANNGLGAIYIVFGDAFYLPVMDTSNINILNGSIITSEVPINPNFPPPMRGNSIHLALISSSSQFDIIFSTPLESGPGTLSSGLITVVNANSWPLEYNISLPDQTGYRMFFHESRAFIGSQVRAHDFNGDGKNDIIFTAPFSSNVSDPTVENNGAVHVCFGVGNGTPCDFSTSTQWQETYSYAPQESHQYFGYSGTVGDVNNDFLPDLVYATRGFNPETREMNSQTIHVIYGRCNNVTHVKANTGICQVSCPPSTCPDANNACYPC